MFRGFEKYARAISDDGERKSFYKLYCAKTLISAAFYILCIALVAEALIFAEAMKAGDSVAPFAVFGITLVLWLCSAIAAFTLWIIFRVKFAAVCRRAPSAEEMPEVVTYRQKTVETKKSLIKSLWWAMLLVVVGGIFFVVGVALDTVQNPDSSDLGIWSGVGIGVFSVCFFIFFFALLIFKSKQSAKGQTLEIQTEKEVKAIDSAQGRKHRYSLQEDGNAVTLRYLFPSPDLRAMAESLNSKRLTVSLLSAIVSCIIGAAVALIFFSPLIFDWKIAGYAFPVLISIVFIAVFFAVLPFVLKQSALEKTQKKILEDYSVYRKNLDLYRKYEKFSKGKGNIFLIICLASLICAYILAVLFPSELWSLLTAVPLFVGLFVNNLLISGLRKDAKLIEDEIDAEGKTVKFYLQNEESSDAAAEISDDGFGKTITTTQEKPACRLVSDGKFGCILGLNCQNKRVESLTLFFDDKILLTEEIPAPEESPAGRLYLDDERNYPPSFIRNIEFVSQCSYDPENKVLKVGENAANSLTKIFANVYVALDDDGSLLCLLLSGIDRL